MTKTVKKKVRKKVVSKKTSVAPPVEMGDVPVDPVAELSQLAVTVVNIPLGDMDKWFKPKFSKLATAIGKVAVSLASALDVAAKKQVAADAQRKRYQDKIDKLNTN